MTHPHKITERDAPWKSAVPAREFKPDPVNVQPWSVADPDEYVWALRDRLNRRAKFVAPLNLMRPTGGQSSGFWETIIAGAVFVLLINCIALVLA